MGFEGVRQERRYDPNEYARKKHAKMERARKLRSKRLDGTADLDEECTFAPKYVYMWWCYYLQLIANRVNTKYRPPAHTKRKENNEPYGDDYYDDSLDQLSHRHTPRRRNVEQNDDYSAPPPRK